MQNLKFDPRHPQTPQPMTIKIGMGDNDLDIYPSAKLHYDPIRELWPHICEVVYQMFTRLVFGFFQHAIPKAAAPILTLNTPKDVFSHKNVPFGKPENKILHF